MTIFDNGVKILTVPSNRQKYLKITHKKLVKSNNKTIKKHQLLVFYFASKMRQKIFEKYFKKVLTTRKRYAKISFVHTEWANNKKYIEK